MESAYDRIAQWYDVDMARNMRFDDTAFYAELCLRRGGRVLELGCGNGRILLELIRRGLDAVGVDVSSAMLHELQRKAALSGLNVRACRMDVRSLAFARGFDVVLCPYSLVTYMAQPGDLEKMLAQIQHVLVPRGTLVMDAFVPRQSATGTDYRLDYRRPVGGHELARYKRVVPLTHDVNRVERRYELVSSNGTVLQALDTAEDIRTFSPPRLMQALSIAGFEPDGTWWDYGHASDEVQAQFFTVAARTSSGASRAPLA